MTELSQDWQRWIFHAMNLIPVILMILLPFVVWEWYKKFGTKRNQRLDAMQQEIDDLKKQIKDKA